MRWHTDDTDSLCESADLYGFFCHFEEREIALGNQQRLEISFAEFLVRFLVPRNDKLYVTSDVSLKLQQHHLTDNLLPAVKSDNEKVNRRFR